MRIGVDVGGGGGEVKGFLSHTRIITFYVKMNLWREERNKARGWLMWKI
jgi:hypothetical protein